jgi:hypothetical protein
MVYNINDTATQVLAAKQVKENIFVDLVHKNGYGVTQQEETNVSTLRMMKVLPTEASARAVGSATNGAFFNDSNAEVPKVTEYDLNLLYVYDKVYDLPELQQDMCPVNIFDETTKNIGGRIATEINASTIAEQLVNRYNAAKKASAWKDIAVELPATGGYYEAIQDASTMLDDGDEDNGIQAFPFEEREIIMRPTFRKNLLSDKGVLLGGSNYAQSMLAKGAVSPDAKKEWGNMYCGEIDLIPCYIAPKALWSRAGLWTYTTASGTNTQGTATTFDAVQAMVCAKSATDRGISTQDYIKIIDSPNGAGKRLQPKTRWGINVCYGKGIVPIISGGTTAPTAELKMQAPGSFAA